MKLTSKFATVAGMLAIGGAVYAFQDQAPPPAADSHKATSSIVLDDKSGDEISVTYRTVKYSQKQIDAMKTDEEARKAWAQYIPMKLEATLSTDVPLYYKTAKEHTLEKGKYAVSFAMNADQSWTLFLKNGDRQVGKVNLKAMDSAVEFDHFTFNLMTAGDHDYKLAVGYGKMGAMIPFSTKASAGQ